ncbi:hypothetical protein VTN96DRAFT_3374 [Rasamsonia emersonii]
MVAKGVAGEDIQFLVQVLHPDPNDRLNVREILERLGFRQSRHPSLGKPRLFSGRLEAFLARISKDKVCSLSP